MLYFLQLLLISVIIVWFKVEQWHLESALGY
jgi:hypothetical protein